MSAIHDLGVSGFSGDTHLIDMTGRKHYFLLV
jgi:hypothetical protein